METEKQYEEVGSILAKRPAPKRPVLKNTGELKKLISVSKPDPMLMMNDDHFLSSSAIDTLKAIA